MLSLIHLYQIVCIILQIGKIVCSARDEKRGYHLYGNLLHPKTEIVYGILEKESSELLKNFFLQKRFP